jgi:hypothetical protein
LGYRTVHHADDSNVDVNEIKKHTMTFGTIATISRVTLEQVMTGSLEMVVGSAVSPVFVPSIYISTFS